MSLKNLFGKGVKNYKSASIDVESSTFIDKKVKEQQTYIPPIDFSTASNFVKFGLAELYYDNSISRIYNNYPYDGSKAEKIDFHQSSSYLDRWMFEEKYPKTTGYITMGTTGYQGALPADGYGTTTTNEYIRVWGGIHTASVGMSTKPLRETFDKSGKYNLDLNRTQNWRCNPLSGSTIEFWLRVPDWSALTERQVILHLDNGVATGVGMGTLILEIHRPSANNGVFQLTLKDSVPNGPMQAAVCDAISDASFAQWHHYALTIKNGSTGIDTNFYIDGVESKRITDLGSIGNTLLELPGLITGFVGALQTTNPAGDGGLGKGKLSGSLDEFRYWKTARTGQQIGLNWFRQIGGGANTDDSTANKDLGVYYKFNEGIVNNTSIDNTVLDYSGRIANGLWKGYASTVSYSRNTGSAFASSSYGYLETENPIIYSSHPKVKSLVSEMSTSGSQYDNETGRSLFYSLPEWMTSEDASEGSNNLKYLTQIIASYFDTLHAQITALPNLKNKLYVQKGDKPLPFASQLLSDKGFITRNIFTDSDIVNLFSGVDFNAIKFQENLEKTRNLIYLNIYNNLEAIYKSKGTEKSIRNLIRCFGIDDEIIKLNVYTDGGTHYFTDKAKASSVKKKYINFDSPSFFNSTMFQSSSATNPLTFISGSRTNTSASMNAFTLEADIVVPYKKESSEIGYYSTPFLSSSIFGFHEALSNEPTNYNWADLLPSGDPKHSLTASLSVFLVRDELNSKNAQFVVESQDGTLRLTSSYIQNIYDNNHWNAALRIKPNSYPYSKTMPYAPVPTPGYTLDFYAVNYNFDTLENEIHLTTPLTYAIGSAFLNRAKRVYAGAQLTNFSGALIQRSDVQVGAVRAWFDYLDNQAIRSHNLDPLNFGNSEAFRGSNIFTVPNKQIPSQELTIFNWDFSLVTGSDPGTGSDRFTSGSFIIDDITSGSTNTIYAPWLDELIRREYRGRGANFGPSTTRFIENEFLYAQKKELPEISYTNDNVFIKTNKDIDFIKDDDVSDNFYVLEKSMNQIVSEQMLNLFSSVQEFANLMGRPVDRYRMGYKRLDKVRQDFFTRVDGDPDQERFIQFYKWIDGNISKMIAQLIPASVNFGEGVTDVIESHILERNKYQRRIGLLDTLQATEGIMKGVEELTYNWEYGHAPQESYLPSSFLRIGKTGGGSAGYPVESDSDEYSPALGSSDWAFYGRVRLLATGELRIYGRQPVKRATNSWYIRITSTQISIAFADSGGSGGDKTWWGTVSDLGTDWHHVGIFYDSTHGHGDDAIKIYLNGALVTQGTPSDPSSITGIFGFDGIRLRANNAIGNDWDIDEFGIIDGSLSETQANELYNNGDYRNITSYSDLANVFLHYRIGQNGRDSDADGGTLYPQIGNHNLSVANNATDGYPAITPYASWGASFIAEGNNNCLWRNERYERGDIPDREKIREVIVNQTNATSSTLSTIDKTIYQGSTFIRRRLSRPYKVGIEFNNSIHGGINYPPQKDREFYRSLITPWGSKDSSGAPRNIYTVGISLGDAIIRKQYCSDVYDPMKKDYIHFECVAGKYALNYGDAPKLPSMEYFYKLHSSMYWPFNLVSGTLKTGYAKHVYDNYSETAIVTNVHSDTTDLTNEIPIQGPFTEAHVGGLQFRHVDLNKYDPNLKDPDGTATDNNLQDAYNRPEGFRYLFGENPLRPTPPHTDGAMGLTGPDYGGDYPDQTKKYAWWYREERAKRPVNVKNIQTTTASAVHGNYQHKYEVLSTFGMRAQRFRMREELATTGQGLFGPTYSTLPQTTQPMSLMSAGTFGNQRAFIQLDATTSLDDAVGGSQLIISQINSFGETDRHVFTIDTALDWDSSDATRIGTNNMTALGRYTGALWRALDAAITAGSIKATISPATVPASETHIYLSFLHPGQVFIQLPEWGTTIGIIAQWLRMGSGNRFGVTNVLPSQLSGAKKQKSIITTRFSAPGSYETMSEAFLNISSLEFSAYNNLNYRNLSVRSSGSGESAAIFNSQSPPYDQKEFSHTTRVQSNLLKREGNRTLLARWLGKGGLDSQWGSITTADATGSTFKAAFYKQHRNTLMTPKIANTRRRNAIESPATLIKPAMASAFPILRPWPTTGGISISVWIKLNSFSMSTADQRYILMAIDNAGSPWYNYAFKNIKDMGGWQALDFNFSDINGDTNVWRLDDFEQIVNLGEWYFITVAWGGDRNVAPKFYVGDKPYAARAKVFNATSNIREPTRRIRIFDDTTSFNTGELDGALANLAVWGKELTHTEVSDLFESNGKALAVSYCSSLVDYWKLDTSVAPNTGIGEGVVLPSEIGGDNLITHHNLTSSLGPYDVNTYEDKNQHDNMNYNSLLPRSSYQYSWIRQSVSGNLLQFDSTNNKTPPEFGAIIKNQKVRGYAPKSGKMMIVGNGSLASLKSAIEWPLISDIPCCTTLIASTITIKWEADGDAQTGGKESTSTTLVTGDFYIVNSAPSNSDELRLTEGNQLPITPSAEFDSCCEMEYCMVMKGHINGLGGDAVDNYSDCNEPWVKSVPSYGTNNGTTYNFSYDVAQSRSVFVKFMARCGPGEPIMSIETEFKHTYATATS